MQNKSVVIGVGNILFKDDGIGVIVVEYIKRNYQFTPTLELIDGGTLGFDLAKYFLEYENVLIVDTISIEDEAGEIYKIPSQKLLGGSGYKNTAHEVEVIQMLESCELYDKKANVTVFGIVPKDISSVDIGLSNVLEDKFDILVDSIIDDIKIMGFIPNKIQSYTLDEIVKSLQRI